MLLVAHDHRHQLAFRIERNLCHALEAFAARAIHAQLAFGHQQRGLGRVALDVPVAVATIAQRGIAGERTAGQHRAVLGMQWPLLQYGAFMLQLAHGRIAHARHMAFS